MRPSPAGMLRDDVRVAMPLTLDVLRVSGGVITELITFHADRFAGLGLPERLTV